MDCDDVGVNDVVAVAIVRMLRCLRFGARDQEMVVESRETKETSEDRRVSVDHLILMETFDLSGRNAKVKGQQGRIHGYPSRVQVGRRRAGEGH